MSTAEQQAVAGLRGAVTELRADLERASTAAPRPELDWERDWQGRPRILADPTWTVETAPPGWVVDGQLLAEREYTRVTTHAEALQDSSALTRWKIRRVLIGMSRRLDYVTAVAALTTEDRDRAALDDLGEKALEAAGPNAAEVGTALHGFTERIDRGEDLGVAPPEYAGTLDAYRRAVSHLRFVEYECRTVCDELEAAGTPDRLGFCDVPDPDGIVDELRMIDTKTGRVDYSAGKFSTQLAIYRRSRLYHPGTGERTSWQQKYGQPVSRWGLVVHVPAGADTAELLWLDLEHGDRGGELALDVRGWRKGATSGRLLRPVFARAPRPATTDGTCRGRKQDGTPCGYRRKAKDADPLVAQYCGRHIDQAVQLGRWLAENPDMDPASGVQELPVMRPVQPSSPAAVPHTWAQEQARADASEVAPEATDVTDGGLAAEAERHGILTVDRYLPNGHLAAAVGALCVTVDGARWVKVQREDAYGWEREDRVLEAGGPDKVRCKGSGLLVTQCACSVHRPELVRTAGELLEVTPAGSARLWGETDAQADLAAHAQAEHLRVLQEAAPPITMQEMQRQSDLAAQAFAGAQAASAVVAEQQRPARELNLETMQEGYRPAADVMEPLPYQPGGNAMGLPMDPAPVDDLSPMAEQVAAVSRGDDPAGARWDPVVGTYALDPATEVNGNPRPVAGLQRPRDVAAALRDAQEALHGQIDAANGETDLLIVYRGAGELWSAGHTEHAARRSAELAELHARERPESALIAALQTAPTEDMLRTLWAEYGSSVLWTAEAGVTASRRLEQLRAAALL